MTSDVTFDDVKGYDEAKADLQEIADILQTQIASHLWGQATQGVLLMVR